MRNTFWWYFCKRNYDFVGVIDDEKKYFGYAKDGVLNICDEYLHKHSFEDIGIKEDIIVLYDTVDCYLHIAQGKEEVYTQYLCYPYVINKERRIIARFNNIASAVSLLRINSESVVVLEGDNLNNYILKPEEAPIVKNILGKPNIDKQKSIIVLNGIIYEELKFLMCYNDYYFFSHKGICKIYHSKYGFIHEGNVKLIWALPENSQYIIEEKESDGKSFTIDVLSLYPSACHIKDSFAVLSDSNSLDFFHATCSQKNLVCSIGIYKLLIIHLKDTNEVTHDVTNVFSNGELKLVNDNHIVCKSYSWLKIYDICGERMFETYNYSSDTHKYLIIEKKINNEIIFYGVMNSINYDIIIPPIYSEIKPISNNREIGLFEVTLPVSPDGNMHNISGVVSAKSGQVVPFGSTYEFAKYSNTMISYLFGQDLTVEIISDSYLVYEFNGFKGLVYDGQNVLEPIYDDIIGFEYEEKIDKEWQDVTRYKEFGITSQWAPTCVLLKKNNLWGIYSKGNSFIFPEFESINAIRVNKKNCFFSATKSGSIYLISSNAGVLFCLPSEYIFLKLGIGRSSFVFAFKSTVEQNYMFLNYKGEKLETVQQNSRYIKVMSKSRYFLFDIELEKFQKSARPKQIEDDLSYIDSGYTQDELNDMYRDAFDGNPDYESNID